MAYFLGRDVAVTIAAGNTIGVSGTAPAALDFDGTEDARFCNATDAGLAVSDLTGVDLGIGVTDEDVTYMGSRTVLKAEIKKETTISLTRKKINNVWDVVFNGSGGGEGARWGHDGTNKIANLAGEPDVTTATSPGANYFGYQLKITMKAGTEVFKVPNMQIVGHTVTLNADGTTEETLEFLSQESPTIAST